MYGIFFGMARAHCECIFGSLRVRHGVDILSVRCEVIFFISFCVVRYGFFRKCMRVQFVFSYLYERIVCFSIGSGGMLG